MSVINSSKSESVISNSYMGTVEPSDKKLSGYVLIGKQEEKNTSLQMMAKKIAMSFNKSKIPSDVKQNIFFQSNEIENRITPVNSQPTNILKENVVSSNEENNHLIIKSDFFELFNCQEKNIIDANNVNPLVSNIKDEPHEIQLTKEDEFIFLQHNESDINKSQVASIEEEVDDVLLTQSEFDDEIPLINLNGMLAIPLRDSPLPVKPLFGLTQAALMPKSTPLYFGAVDEQHNDGTHFIQLSHEEKSGHQVVNVELGSDKETVLHNEKASHFSDVGALDDQQSLIQTFADFRQELTKNEKKAPVLQEMLNIENANMVQNSSSRIDVVGEVYRQTQAAPLQGTTANPQSINQPIEYNSISHSLLANENEPRTLTYTFHQWKNTPSVTFELATKTELVALTQSQEVQETLKENKHLLNSEQDIYFHQEQHKERGQHHPQQEHHQQEED
ncbi:hypothetical protein ABN063_16020 [Providencia vermicola]|uniref:SpaN/EivJ family type III secretion system needle length determinant n=1 Tax=Providencia vermicola TaxID=333965 RepID=UPI0032D9D81D